MVGEEVFQLQSHIVYSLFHGIALYGAAAVGPTGRRCNEVAAPYLVYIYARGGTCNQYLVALAAACGYEVKYLSVEVASRLQTEYVEHVGSFAGGSYGTVFHGLVRYKPHASQSIQAQYGHNPVYATVPQGVCKGCAQKQLKAVYLEQCAVEVYYGYSSFF